MDEHYTDNDKAAPVLPTSKPGEYCHGSPIEGRKTYGEAEGALEVENTNTSTNNEGDETASKLKQMSCDDPQDEGNISRQECIDTGQGKHETKHEKNLLSNISVFTKDQEYKEASAREEDNIKKVDKTEQGPTSVGCKFNETLKEAEEQYAYFWEARDPFSQWHRSKFQLNEQTFSCAEQYMMYTKAVFFHDDRLAKKIMNCTDPSRIKSLGRKTEQFSEDLWVNNCLHVVKEGNKAKFNQNVELKARLIGTYPRILVEASPYDKVWGIGLKKYEPCAWNEATWEGKNLLGYILTEVRDELMYESEMILKHQRKVYLEKLTHDLVKSSSGKKGAYDRSPRDIYCRSSNPHHTTEGARHSDHHAHNLKGNRRDGNEFIGRDATTRSDRNARIHEDISRTSASPSSGRETDNNDPRLESNYETDSSVKTYHEKNAKGTRSDDVCSEKRNKNENPRCTSEQHPRAVCMEPIGPDCRLYKPECK